MPLGHGIDNVELQKSLSAGQPGIASFTRLAPTIYVDFQILREATRRVRADSRSKGGSNITQRWQVRRFIVSWYKIQAITHLKFFVAAHQKRA